MAILPASGYLSDDARTEAEMKSALETQRDYIAQIVGGAPPTELVIDSGGTLAAPTQHTHSMDTYVDAASDNLDHIPVTNLPDGSFLALWIENPARKITVRHAQGGTGQIYLKGIIPNHYEMNSPGQILVVQRRGLYWYEHLRHGREVRHQVGVGDAPSFQGNWSGALYYTKDSDQIVHVTGSISNSVAINALDIIVTLPQGWAPSAADIPYAVCPTLVAGQFVSLLVVGSDLSVLNENVTTEPGASILMNFFYLAT